MKQLVLDCSFCRVMLRDGSTLWCVQWDQFITSMHYCEVSLWMLEVNFDVQMAIVMISVSTMSKSSRSPCRSLPRYVHPVNSSWNQVHQDTLVMFYDIIFGHLTTVECKITTCCISYKGIIWSLRKDVELIHFHVSLRYCHSLLQFLLLVWHQLWLTRSFIYLKCWVGISWEYGSNLTSVLNILHKTATSGTTFQHM